MRASAAWTLPTCLCSSPWRERMNTSNNGHSCSVDILWSSGGPGRSCTLLAGMCNGCIAHPPPLLLCLAACFEPFAVAGAIAFQHILELAPVDGTEAKVLRGFVPFEVRVWHFQTEKLGLRRCDVHEVLTQL